MVIWFQMWYFHFMGVEFVLEYFVKFHAFVPIFFLQYAGEL
jgi:hypothetical protein